MQECGKKCGIDNTEKELYYNFRVVPLPILAGANGPVRLPSALSGGGGKASFFMHFSVPAGTRRSRPGRCGRRHRSGCGNKCRIHDDPDPYDIVEAVNDLTEAVEAVQKSIIWTRKARTCTGVR